MQDTDEIRVLVFHADPLVAVGVFTTFAQQAGFDPVPALAISGDAPASVVVADYDQGLRFAAGDVPPALGSHARAHVLVLTPRQSEREIRHALEHGVRGYMDLGCALDELLCATRTLHRGLRYLGSGAAERLADSVAGPSLTERETDVLRLLAEGHGNKTIAMQLAIAPGTVKSHLKTIFQKLDANTRTEAAAVADRRGLLCVPGGLGFAVRQRGRAVGFSTAMS